jgi:formyltetrahydrofolate deformylase
MSVETARLLITCPDARGIIAAVSSFITQYDGNILDADQHTDHEHGEFFMRIEIELNGFRLNRETFRAAWEPLAAKLNIRSSCHWGNITKRMAILVSRQGHCLNDLLWRWHTGEQRVQVPLVISNHPDWRQTVETLGAAYHHLPVTADTKREQEQQIQRLLEDARVDFVVLARYMQILSPEFVARWPGRIINIHHSFLPAFAGPRPYHHAFETGVKLIGATSHYVTEHLDQGPIIAQSTRRVDHRDSVEDMIRKGRDLERVVLAEAVRLHVEDRILANHNKTVVFD